ncbi:hypothetical protein BC628DRAFT_1416192 [Trametes gibbosa]|nr:hypothetical protein BC628DRAFT_1416192 [Trametes gibbosa]
MSAYPAPLLHYPLYQLQDPLVEDAELVSASYHSRALPPHSRPHLHVSTAYGSTCQPEDEYLVRDFFTPSSSSGSPSDQTFLSLPSAEEPSTPNQRSSLAVSSRRDMRRRGSEPSTSCEGIVVRGSIPHPYARLESKKQGAGKRRKMWNHALEKMLFTPQEISTMGAPHRRTIYTASLEAHVDLLHEQFMNLPDFPVRPEQLEPYIGLNSKTAKSMVSGLHHDVTELKLKIREVERANRNLEERLTSFASGYKSCL